MERVPDLRYGPRVTPGYEVYVTVADYENDGARSVYGAEHEELHRSGDEDAEGTIAGPGSASGTFRVGKPLDTAISC